MPLTQVITDDFLERELAVQLAVEVRRAWKQGHLTAGKLGGGRVGKNTRYELQESIVIMREIRALPVV